MSNEIKPTEQSLVKIVTVLQSMNTHLDYISRSLKNIESEVKAIAMDNR